MNFVRILLPKAYGVFLCGLLALVPPSCTSMAQPDEWAQRDRWQNVPAILEAMGVSPGARVADVGARDGYLTVRLAAAVGPQGRVFAVDIDRQALDKLRRNLADEDTSRVTIIHSAQDDPMLPERALDAVVIINAYHEMDAYAAMLRHIKEALKPGGRLVLVEPIATARRDASRAVQAAEHEIALPFARQDLEDAGFEILEAQDPFVERKHRGDGMWLLVGRRPAS